MVWSGDPLSNFSRCEQTWIDGRKYFDMEEDRQRRRDVHALRAKLVQKILASGADMAAEGEEDPKSDRWVVRDDIYCGARLRRGLAELIGPPTELFNNTIGFRIDDGNKQTPLAFARKQRRCFFWQPRAWRSPMTLFPPPITTARSQSTGATIHPVAGKSISGGVIVIEKGKVAAIGADVKPPPDAKIVDASGKHVYPGLIDAFFQHWSGRDQRRASDAGLRRGGGHQPQQQSTSGDQSR